MTGCGSSDSTESEPATDAGSKAGVAAAQKEIDAYRAVPTFSAPGPAFDAKKASAGKTLLSIPASSSIPFVQTLQNGVKDLSSEVGLKFVDWPNQGRSSQWVQGMDAAVGRKVSAINLMAGVNPAAIGPQVAKAEAADIPVLASHLYDVGDTPAAGVDTASVQYEQAGRLLANWVVAKTGGDSHTLVVKIDEVVSTKPMMKGISDVFDERCGSGCPVTTINVAIADVATRIQPQVQSALTKDPKIKYVIALYDSAEAPFVVSAIKQSGASGRVKVVTFNGTPSILELVKSGDVEMDIGENLDWTAHAILDQSMRLAGGLPAVKDAKIPLRVFDKDNVGETGDPPQTDKGFGDSYEAGYRKLWGLGG